MNERASLGRIEPWARVIALGIWAFCGISRFDGTPRLWLLPWVVYGVALGVSFARLWLPNWLNVTLLLIESVAVLSLPRLGLVGFEGLLLSLVVVQVPLVLSLRAALIWALAHLPVLLPIVAPFNNTTQQLEMVGAYSSFIAFAMLVYWLRQQERRARAELARSNATLLATRAMLVEGSRQAERLRISRELHDSLGHHLTALKLQLELAHRQTDGKALESISRAREISSSSLAEVRKVVTQMQTGEDLDVVASLKALAGGIPSPRIQISSPEVLGLQDGEARHAVFRCVQEAITNSVKHASAQNVWVDIVREPDTLRITVRDDGAGVREVKSGNGLTGMSARVAHVGGSARFESTPGRGFSVQLQVPVR